MKTLVIGFVLAVGLILSLPQAQGQDKHPPSNPGPVHGKLAKLAGEYTTEAKFSVKPGDEPQVTKGTAKLTMILGGRFLKEENGGQMLGSEFHGLRLYGYNPGAQQFEATWVYTGSTSLMHLTGTSKDDGKTIEWAGSFDAAKDNKMALFVTTKVIDDDHFVNELYAKMPDGTRGPTFTTSYTRKK